MLTVDDTPVSLELFDDPSDLGDNELLRSLSYSEIDLFIVCFSVINRVSFDNIATKWVPELRHFSPATPILLVGTKSDLREDSALRQYFREMNIRPISSEQGADLTRSLREAGVIDIRECSALTMDGVKLLFDATARLALKQTPIKLVNQKANKNQATKKACNLL